MPTLELREVGKSYGGLPAVDGVSIGADEGEILAIVGPNGAGKSTLLKLIVGLERERGFRELVRRVGKERASTQRFGRKFDVRAYPTKEELAALSLHVCGAFEDWAYALFREENALIPSAQQAQAPHPACAFERLPGRAVGADPGDRS